MKRVYPLIASLVVMGFAGTVGYLMLSTVAAYDVANGLEVE